MAKHALGYDGWGNFVEWYRDDDNSSGYGDNPETARWYGTPPECRARALEPPPHDGWEPIGAYDNYRDAATQTGMYDHW